jgi:hypothetical protein
VAPGGGVAPDGTSSGSGTPGSGSAGSGSSGSGSTGPGTLGNGSANGGTATGPGGGGFGGDSAGLTQALAYVESHGGGTIAVSSQSGAASVIIQSGGDVAGIGGFSGRESEVSLQWLAEAVRSGRIRWVLTSGSGGFGGNDGRVGSSAVMAAVQQIGKKVTVTSGSSTVTLYDLSGLADQLAAAS